MRTDLGRLLYLYGRVGGQSVGDAAGAHYYTSSWIAPKSDVLTQ